MALISYIPKAGSTCIYFFILQFAEMDIMVNVQTFCIRWIEFDLRKGRTEWTLHVWKNYYV